MNCGTDDVVAYHIWYSPITGQEMQLIATVTTDTTIIYQQLESVAGCYAVTALDTFNNESSFSNIVCIDNCPLYELPNVFTPNGDNTNDFFIPFPYLAVKSVDLKIYDRWGVVVFETMDPAIGWDGTNQQNGKACVDGVYYYTCTVHEIRLEGVVARKIQGFVHVLR
ncbi:MAG TPA: gliding motility-associated C-terminal domain-containing protein, partial [Bacteroidia bacterium]|nr:gliding motility-associated C-terminal domain-containing protein [Bacteroidia bacterium]